MKDAATSVGRAEAADRATYADAAENAYADAVAHAVAYAYAYAYAAASAATVDDWTPTP